MRIVVAGGTGFLGRALVERLSGDHDVAVLTRHPRSSTDIAWSPQRPDDAWVRAVQEADVVVNLAGESLDSGRWTAARKAMIVDSRIGPTRALADAIRSASRPPAFLSASAVGIYGSRDEDTITEGSSLGSDFLARLCRDWETEAQRAADVTRVVLLRSGVVLSGSGGALPRIALPFKLFAGGTLGSGRQFLSWIHLDDWLEMVCWAMASMPFDGPINLTAPGPVTYAELARTLGRVLHRPTLMPAPAFALRLVLGEMADAMILSGQRVLPQKAQALGFAFRYPSLEPALRSIYG